LGSHEAYQDQEFTAALDTVAGRFGLFITSSEGCGTDILAALCLEPEAAGVSGLEHTDDDQNDKEAPQALLGNQ